MLCDTEVLEDLALDERLAARLGRIDEPRVQRHHDVVRSYDLPEALPPGIDLDGVVETMARDKKATGGLTFVLDGPAGVEVVHDVPRADVQAVLEEMQA